MPDSFLRRGGGSISKPRFVQRRKEVRVLEKPSGISFTVLIAEVFELTTDLSFWTSSFAH